MKNFIGIDCSSKAIHSVWLGNGGSILKKVKWEHKSKEFEERFLNFVSDFDHYLSTINIEAQAAVEAAIFIQNPKSTISLSSVVGCVKYLCYKYGINCRPIDNTKWKKDIIGKGNASKLEIKAFAEKHWGETFEEQDFADAACIALWIKRKFELEKINGQEKQEDKKRKVTKG